MPAGYAALARTDARPLAFGFLHTVSATVGQTFLISLFLPDLKRVLGMGDAAVAGLFALATLVSALLLAGIGRWIDRVDLVRYSLASAGVLTLGCIAAAFSPTIAVFTAALFAMRLGGNGLLTHVAFTSTARYFTAGRGKALSLISIGSSVGEAGLGLVVVHLIDAWGWRATLVCAGAFALLLVAGAAALVRTNRRFRHPEQGGVPAMESPSHRRRLTPHPTPARYFVLTAPLFAATPLIVTALVFHQGVIAQSKGLSLQLFAMAFVAFSVSRIASSLVVGGAIDRFGATRLFTLHLLPFGAGVAMLAAGSSPWVVPAYWILTGITGGFAATLQVAVVAEHVAPTRLGRIRSLYASMTIVASAAGPPLYGALIAAGVPVATLLWASVAAMIAATLMGIAAEGESAI